MLEPKATYQALYDSFTWDIPERYNIGVDVCDKWAQTDPTKPALSHKSRDGFVSRFSFGDMRDLSNQTANLLQSLGLKAGERVAVFLPQTPETAYAHIAIYKLGAVAVPLFSLFGPEALHYRLTNSGARVVITDASGAKKLEGLAGLEQLEHILCIDGAQPNCLDFHTERDQHVTTFTPLNTHADDPALIIYTSGTTGPPKGALHAHRTLLGHLPGVEMAYEFLPGEGDKMWTPADWAWIGGLYDVLMPAWHHGIEVVSHRFEKFGGEAAFELLAECGVRNTFLPPTALKLMRSVKHPQERFDYDLRSVVSAGEPLGAELLEWGRATFGLDINEFYGQTECNMVISSCASIMPTKLGNIGRAVPGHEVAILDKSDAEVPYGSVGQIAVKRPNPVMFLGYWQNPGATKDKFLNDWLLTGDQGMMDDEGYIKFVGRNDDVITSAGYRIGPGEIEDSLLGHPAVKLVAVIGVPDPERTEIVKAFIVLEDNHSPSDALKKELQTFVKTRLAAHEYPRELEFVAELPMTTTGKIMRRKLKEGLR